MEPMKPMKPMEPMAPMTPLTRETGWWPSSLGDPASSGSQNDVRFAFFPDQRRLLIQKNGQISTYDSLEHQISGVSQRSGSHDELVFTSQNGRVDLSELPAIR